MPSYFCSWLSHHWQRKVSCWAITTYTLLGNICVLNPSSRSNLFSLLLKRQHRQVDITPDSKRFNKFLSNLLRIGLQSKLTVNAADDLCCTLQWCVWRRVSRQYKRCFYTNPVNKGFAYLLLYLCILCRCTIKDTLILLLMACPHRTHKRCVKTVGQSHWTSVDGA